MLINITALQTFHLYTKHLYLLLNHTIINVKFKFLKKKGDNIDKEIPIINKINYTHSTTEDQDDIDLYNESFVDIEPYSGGVLRAGQKILISALIEKDELFEIEHDKFVPVYYVFRTGNFTEDGVKYFLIYFFR